jgi:PhoP regulatory network protein YrbL.
VSPVLQLSRLNPIFTGTLRRVYLHPDQPGRLVKIIRPEVIERRWGKGSAWYKRWRRARQFIAVQREVEEYLAVVAREGRRPSFVQKIYGFEDTDLGLGFVTEALRDRDGEIAPTLGALIRAGRCDARVREAYERFAHDFEASHVVIGDFSAENIVLAWDETHGERFVLVDGIGSSTFIPLKAWCPAANRWSKRRQLERIRRQIPQTPLTEAATSFSTAEAVSPVGEMQGPPLPGRLRGITVGALAVSCAWLSPTTTGAPQSMSGHDEPVREKHD